MSQLIIRSGMAKNAAAEDGPSFEQQFGILSNALVAEKYPKLDRYKLAFQLIDKKEDNSRAMGAAVYLVGRTVIFIPSFYRNGSIKTGDMMFLAKEQQFLPLSDPWLAWIQDKDLQQPGEALEQDVEEKGTSQTASTIRDMMDPIIKTGSLYLKGLTRLGGDVTSGAADASLLDTVLGMGKRASAALLDQLVGSNSFLNAALHFYSGDELDGFARKTAALNEEHDAVSVVLPFTKEAAELSPEDREVLMHDGYIIKTAAQGPSPDVIRYENVRDSFKTLSQAGKYKLLKMDGSIRPCLVMRSGTLMPDSCGLHGCGAFEEKSYETGELDARQYMAPVHDGPYGPYSGSSLVAVITEDAERPQQLADNTMMLADPWNEEFRPEMLAKYGRPASPSAVPEIGYSDWVLCPDGKAYRMDTRVFARDKGWYNTCNQSMVVSGDSGQLSPICTGSMCILPKGSRILCRKETSGEPDAGAEAVRGIHSMPFVTWDSLDVFLKAYSDRNYRKVRVTSNGSEASVSGDAGDGRTGSVKEASLQLVRDYGVEPGVARTMLLDCMAGAGAGTAGSRLYLISKTAAAGEDGWVDASTARHPAVNRGSTQEYMQMPTVLESPEQLQQAVQAAAENGIKEVFDVTAFKLLIRQNRFLEEIHDDLPVFMRVLDSLCRKLFMLEWNTDEFAEQYGTVKLKSLEDSLKTTIDSLSELTIFFKLRTVDGDNGLGQDGGDLMQGHDM